MRYQELYEHLGTLTQEQRQQQVKTCGFERPGATIGWVWDVEEDQINPSGDGLEPVSAYDDDPDFDAGDEPIACKAGTVLLCETE